MRIIGILVLILELLSLLITIKGECRKNNITVPKAKEKWFKYVAKHIPKKRK